MNFLLLLSCYYGDDVLAVVILKKKCELRMVP